VEYKKALLINAGLEKNVIKIVIRMKKFLKVKGFNKALTWSAQPCDLCDPCTTATNCKFPKKARPSLRACGIDVSETFHNNGWGDLGQQAPWAPSHAIGIVLVC
jgi:predicted metal-binding protein